MRRHFKKYFVPHKGNDYKPHLLSEEVSFFLLALILLVFVSTQITHTITRHLPSFATVYEGMLVTLTNFDRLKNNAPSLTTNTLLERAARLKALDMAEKHYFAHESPDGHDSWYWLSLVGYDFDYAGENLALDFTESDKVEDAWMNSPTHRDNIVNKNYREIGIATVDGTYQGRPTTFVVQFFGTPKTIEAVAATTPEPKVKEAAVVAVTPSTEPTVLGAETKNTPVEINTVPNVTSIQTIPETASARIPWTTWLRQLLSRSSRIAMAFYGTLAGLILLTLFGMFMLHFRVQHHRHYAHGLLLILILISCMYMSSMLFSGLIFVG